MRIISGKYKGRILKAPKGIRPTEDRVRKALFDILGDVSDLAFLELFAGSGAVGLEALSAGAAQAVFCEKDRQAIKAIQENLKALKAQEEAEILPGDVIDAIEHMARSSRKFDIVFLDPPYYGQSAEKTLQTLGDYDILQTSGYIIVQHFKKDSLPAKQGNLALVRQEKYGDSLLSFYRHHEL
ncbi:MAG: 16S rRNA (guanine(966)-N(2))-methyltransferase RsmD [Candidatus Omnitrophica bacterium]|nr:16S rRNA (guanine(966)-N(2))-methyltransferase RsmD [Candidatus Omnitrophota bacterium]